MTSRPGDTGNAAWATYNAVLDAMDGAARVRAAIDLSEAVRDIRLAGIQARDPGLTRLQAVAHLVREEHGVFLPESQ